MKSSAPDRCLHKKGKCFYGWYHSPHFATAYQYAEKKTILGDHIYSAVFQFESCCMNSCNRSNRWYYTKHECLRYRVVALALVCNREYKLVSRSRIINVIVCIIIIIIIIISQMHGCLRCRPTQPSGAVGDLDAQEFANTAWAFATVGYSNTELFAVLATAAEQRIADIKAQELANTA